MYLWLTQALPGLQPSPPPELPLPSPGVREGVGEDDGLGSRAAAAGGAMRGGLDPLMFELIIGGGGGGVSGSLGERAQGGWLLKLWLLLRWTEPPSWNEFETKAEALCLFIFEEKVKECLDKRGRARGKKEQEARIWGFHVRRPKYRPSESDVENNDGGDPDNEDPSTFFDDNQDDERKDQDIMLEISRTLSGSMLAGFIIIRVMNHETGSELLAEPYQPLYYFPT
ncbi:hypothetical protein EDB87DRAFT_1576660 [Lactarius vividus]|nr:hypothetical protein EDB87DRAFT_1576660 [Lactarius vividus]